MKKNARKIELNFLRVAAGFVTTPPRLPRYFFPAAIEKKAAAQAGRLVDEWRRITAATLTDERLQAWEQAYKQAAGRWDDASGDLFDSMGKTIEELNAKYARAADIAQNGGAVSGGGIAFEVDQWSVRQLRNQATAAKKPVGALDFKPQGVLNAVKQYGRETTDLITATSEQLRRNLERGILDGFEAGESYQSIKKRLLSEGVQGLPGKKPFDTAKKRAKLIARDQIGKLNGRVVRARQEQLGFDRYIWRTVMDERVRGNPAGRYPKAKPSHFIREGVVFDWKKAPEGGHPGEDILCRCWPEPFFEEEHGGDFEKTSASYAKALEQFSKSILKKGGASVAVVAQTAQKSAAVQSKVEQSAESAARAAAGDPDWLTPEERGKYLNEIESLLLPGVRGDGKTYLKKWIHEENNFTDSQVVLMLEAARAKKEKILFKIGVSKTAKAYYNPNYGEKYVLMKGQGYECHVLNRSTFAHEFGHFIDNYSGNSEWMGCSLVAFADFRKVVRDGIDKYGDLSADFAAKLPEMEKIWKDSRGERRRFQTTKEQEQYDIACGISDIFDAMSNGYGKDHGHLCGHGVKYFLARRQNSDSRLLETFANCFAAMSGKTGLTEIERHFPGLGNAFTKGIKRTAMQAKGNL